MPVNPFSATTSVILCLILYPQQQALSFMTSFGFGKHFIHKTSSSNVRITKSHIPSIRRKWKLSTKGIAVPFSSSSSSWHRRRDFLKALAASFTSATVSLLSSSSTSAEEVSSSAAARRIEWKEGNVQVYREHRDGGSSANKTYNIHYKIANPQFLQTRSTPPLVTIHGGPSLPSDYMLPLANAIQKQKQQNNSKNRSIIFYDQLGCGLSDQPKDIQDYSIDLSLQDLQTLITTLGLEEENGRGYHLYGHSFGGMLAYEFVKKQKQEYNSCHSLVLSSTPTSIRQSYDEQVRIEQDLLQEDSNLFTFDERYRQTCQCRTPKKPKPLIDAYEKVGFGTPWCGLDCVMDFECTPPLLSSPSFLVDEGENPDDSTNQQQQRHMPNALILRGEYDFVTQEVMDQWINGSYFNQEDSKIQTHVFKDCSHHVLLENGDEYGRVINEFLLQNE